MQILQKVEVKEEDSTKKVKEEKKKHKIFGL